MRTEKPLPPDSNARKKIKSADLFRITGVNYQLRLSQRTWKVYLANFLPGRYIYYNPEIRREHE